MSDVIFNITNEQFMSVFEPQAERFANSTRTHVLGEAVLHAAKNGDGRACTAPIIDFAIGTALRIIRQSEMPAEIHHRARVGVMLTSLAVMKAFVRGVFENTYDNNKHLSLASELPQSVDHQDKLLDPLILRQFSVSPIIQTSILAGGSLRALHRDGIRTNEAAVIKRSQQLELIANVGHDKERELIDFLGLPYADTNLFDVRGETDPVDIAFTDDTLNFILEITKGPGGCTARDIFLGSSGSLFHQRYQNILDMLLRGNVTASESPEPTYESGTPLENYSIVMG